MVNIVKGDVLIIGGGMTASVAAIESANKNTDTIIVNKGNFMTSGSSPVCLGGLATIMDPNDRPELLFKDLLRVGCGVNEQNLIWEAARGAAENQRFLEQMGVEFIKHPDGKYWIFKGAGHSFPRGLTVDKNIMEISSLAAVSKEAWHKGVRLYDNIRITNILVNEDNEVTGALGVSRNGKFYLFETKAIILAAGGANNLYPNAAKQIKDTKHWTVGDAYVLAFNIGIPLICMEFPNFREGESVGIHRVGGCLINAEGEKFMKKYDPIFQDKASRGKVVEAMYIESQEGRAPIYWQLPNEIPEVVKNRDPEKWIGRGGKKIEVEIDFQSLIGGAMINEEAQTNIKGLYAAGESAGGYHGADRMMSMRFLELSIFGRKAGRNAAEYALKADVEIDINQVKEEVDGLKQIMHTNVGQEPSIVIDKVRNTMWRYCSIAKEAEGMEKGLEILQEIKKETIVGKNLFAALDAKNIILTAEFVIRASLVREETRGLHTRRDFPERDDSKWLKHVAIKNYNGEITTTTIPTTKINK